MNAVMPRSEIPITINADMGESIGIHNFGNDVELLEYVDTINVAGGMHAGDPTGIARIITKALDRGVTVGAHPGLPDIAGFGRRELAVTAEEVRDLIRYQTGVVVAFVESVGGTLHHIKPHGALFGMLSRSEELMEAACDVAVQYGVPVFGLAGTAHEKIAIARGVEFVSEYYVDLDYNDEGAIIVNRMGTVRDLEEVEERSTRALNDGTTVSVNGKVVKVRAESFCVHSDLPNAPAVAARLREVLNRNGR